MSHPVLARPAPPGPSRDRFLAFAFAAADLLVEATADGTIVFADGAFNARFGRPAAGFVGGGLNALVAAEDQAAVSLAVSTARQHGRASPLLVRLADAEGSRMSLSVLAMHDGARFFATFSRPALRATPALEAAGRFQEVAEARLRAAGRGGTLGFVEVQGWAEASRARSPREQQALETEVLAAVHRHAGPGATAGDLSGGRFGVLTAGEADMAALADEIGQVLSGGRLADKPLVRGAGLDLDGSSLGPARAARGLRLALGGFRDGGLAAAARLGLGGGLVGFVAAADARIEATREAIQQRRFNLHFQPVVTLRDRQVHHYEALLRPISTPQLAVGGVQEFVLFAEAAGLSEELDWAVLDHAASMSEATQGVAIAVNISGLSMQSSAFRARMLERLAQATKLGANLLIELTETADIDDFGSASESMAGLRAAGIPVCLDDFGAGSATFRYLREFRVDYVKLDGGYVRGALTNAREHGFLLSMVELANFMGAKTVAETIETEAQARLMREIGVEFGQGYLFGKPAPLAAFE
jgi:EAL domain-containing protein (putative c-di-GMP-specific phosphodiesterase class I)